ncbi:hypothetical protein [Candidatus Ferrigenium straubiae]|jgi:hypothetical protein|uniref:hypothetical protein n=1 Tax=Candidatus Ferrigenium straubiae TaxID=2919506 RepID=UPI003F4ADD20
MQLLLFLSANHLHAQVMAHGNISAQHEFTASPEGQANFAAFLQEAKHPTYLLVDLIEEDFRQETVPHMIGRSRSALLERKFEQFYRSTPFREATLLQRQKTGRRDDDMLFSALTNPALIKPWLDIMLAQQIPLAGIYSVPQISSPLVKDHPSNHLLLISWEKSAGLRQTYFINHRLQISRLTPLRSGMTFQNAVVEELTRTYQYLKSLSLLPPGQTLDVRLLGHGRDLLELQLELPRSADMHYDFADLADIASQHRIDYRFDDSDATQVFLHQLAVQPPQAHYANATHTHYFTLWQLRHVLNLASATLLFGMLLWGTANLWQSRRDAVEAASLRTAAQRTLEVAQNITHTFPSTYAPAADMKAGVSIMRVLNRYDSTPDHILLPVSAALDRHPQVQLDELSWRMDAAEPVAPNTLADVPAQVITLKGHLTGFAADYRAALNYLEHFQRDLAAQGYQVTMLARPLDVSPGGSIADQRETSANALNFSLKISRRPTA